MLLCCLFCAGSVPTGAEILCVSGKGQRQLEQGVMDLLQLMPLVVWAPRAAKCSQEAGGLSHGAGYSELGFS